jgi:hypothetical protein
MAEKRQCSFGCDKYGTWRSGMCPNCRSYIRRADKRPLAWRLMRREQIGIWNDRLQFTLKHDRDNVVALTAKQINRITPEERVTRVKPPQPIKLRTVRGNG